MVEQSGTARLAPLAQSDWPAEMDEARQTMVAHRPKTLKPPAPNRPRAQNLMGTFAHHPVLARAYFHFSGHLLATSTIPPRERELVILRVGAVRHAEYEFAQHVHLGRECGLTDEEIERAIEGPSAEGWGPLDRALLTAVDELIAHARVSDATWAALSQTYDTKQLMDLVFTIGAYELLAMAFRSFGVPMDDDLKVTTPRLSGSNHEKTRKQNARGGIG